MNGRQRGLGWGLEAPRSGGVYPAGRRLALVVAWIILATGPGCVSGGGGSSAPSTGASAGAGSGGGGSSPGPVQIGFFGAAGSMGSPRFFHTATRLLDGRILVTGGLETASAIAGLPSPLSNAEIYDPQQAGFHQAANRMAGFRFAHRALLEPGGTVLLIGGDLAASIERFNPQTETFVSAGGMLHARLYHTATALPSGEVLITGGIEPSISLAGLRQTPLRATELFDPATARTRPGPDLDRTRFGHQATRLPSGDVLITGGTSVTSTLIYRAASGTFVPGPPLVYAREDHRATLLDDGRILVAGGSDPQGHSLDTGEILDPTASAFRLAPSRIPGGGREDQSQTLLGNGTVLIVGGEDNAAGPGGADIVKTTAALFDPVHESFLALPNPGTARDDHAAVLLPDGSVLLLGGENDQGQGIASCERYLP